MAFSAFPYRQTSGPQFTGISGRHDLLQGQPRLKQQIHDLGGLLTTPILHALTEITDKYPQGKPTPLDSTDFPDSDSRIAALGCLFPRGYGKSQEPLLDDFGKMNLRSGIVELYQELEKIGLLARIPAMPSFANQGEEILLDGTIRWQSYCVLWDAVHSHEYSAYGNIKPWVINELILLGFAGLKLHENDKPGRPPRVIEPTSWGRRFVKLCDNEGENFHFLPKMRDVARRKPITTKTKAPTKLDRFAQAFKDRGLVVAPKLARATSDPEKWLGTPDSSEVSDS